MLKTAIALDSTYTEAYAELADLYNSYNANIAKDKDERRKYLELQEFYITKAMDLNPNISLVHAVKGWVHIDKKEIDKAYKSYRNAINLDEK